MGLEHVDFRFTDNIIKPLRNKEKIYSTFFGQIFYIERQRPGATGILVTIEHVFGIYFSIFGEYTRLAFMNFSYFGLAASAWAVRKGNYSRRRFKGMFNNLQGKLEEGYNKIISGHSLTGENRGILIKGYGLYRKGLDKIEEYIREENSLLLMEGLSLIEEAREELSGKIFSPVFNKYVLYTLKEALQEEG